MEAPIKKFPLNAKEYKLYEEIGEGVSASVYRALCLPLNEVVAIKVLDLERCNKDLDGICREVQTMSLINHPNLIRAYCSFTTGHTLWVVMPFMGGGSCLHIMKSYFPEGFEEPVIATLLTQVLKALVYLHAHGHIHRDVKAGTILADYDGSIKLADFGVSACMFDAGDRQRSRNTFVGTPCWYVIGYDITSCIARPTGAGMLQKIYYRKIPTNINNFKNDIQIDSCNDKFVQNLIHEQMLHKIYRRNKTSL